MQDQLGDEMGDERKFDKIFRNLDTDGSGTLDKGEMMAFMRSLINGPK